MTIYIVKGKTGNFINNQEWVVKSFKTQAAADNYCEQLNAIAQKTYRNEFDAQIFNLNTIDKYKEQRRIESELLVLDENATVDNNGTYYQVAELELE